MSMDEPTAMHLDAAPAPQGSRSRSRSRSLARTDLPPGPNDALPVGQLYHKVWLGKMRTSSLGGLWKLKSIRVENATDSTGLVWMQVVELWQKIE